MSLLLEAILNNEFGTWEQAAQGFGGCVKIGDIVSDVLFIMTMTKFDEVFHDVENRPDMSGYIIVGIVLTIIGVLFDAYKAYVFLREWSELSEEEREERRKNPKRWKRWERWNLWFEEVPQFLLLAVFAATVDEAKYCDVFDDDTDVGEFDDCSEDQTKYSKELTNAGVVSLIFTFISILLHLIRWARNNISLCCNKDAKIKEEHVTEKITETMGSDGFKVIVTERIDGNGNRLSIVKKYESPANEFGLRTITVEHIDSTGNKTITMTNETTV